MVAEIWPYIKMGPPVQAIAFRGRYQPHLPVDAWYDFVCPSATHVQVGQVTLALDAQHRLPWFTVETPFLQGYLMQWPVPEEVEATGICYPAETQLLLEVDTHTWTFSEFDVSFHPLDKQVTITTTSTK